MYHAYNNRCNRDNSQFRDKTGMSSDILYEYKSKRLLVYYLVSFSLFIVMAFAFESLIIVFVGLVFILLLSASFNNGCLSITNRTFKLKQIALLNSCEYSFDWSEILKVEGILGGNTSGVQLYFKDQRTPLFLRLSGFKISDFEKMKTICESLKIQFSYGWRRFG